DRKYSAHVVDGRAAQVRERTRGYHGPDAVPREELQKQRSVMMARYEVRALHPVIAGADGAWQIVLHVRGQLGSLGEKRLGVVRRKLGQELSPAVADPIVVHEENELVRGELHGNLGCDLFQRKV